MSVAGCPALSQGCWSQHTLAVVCLQAPVHKLSLSNFSVPYTTSSPSSKAFIKGQAKSPSNLLDRNTCKNFTVTVWMLLCFA